MAMICGDNRSEIIAKAKAALVESTNIEDSPEEMAVLDNFLFRCWQMGWLDKYEKVILRNNLRDKGADIRQMLTEQELYEQLAEESCELAQAALKKIRANNGTNPTTLTPKEVEANIIEESVDIMIVLSALGYSLGSFVSLAEASPKWHRWAKRLKEAQKKDGAK